MNASKPNTSTNWSKAEAYENTPADYAELPELDDAFFERALRSEGGGPSITDLVETARIERLQDAIVEIWGRSVYTVSSVEKSPNGELLLHFKAVEAGGETIRNR